MSSPFGNHDEPDLVLLPEDDPVPTSEDEYRVALEEIRAQAEQLRETLGKAADVLRASTEVLDGLRAILTYPRAYGWPDPGAAPRRPMGRAA